MEGEGTSPKQDTGEEPGRRGSIMTKEQRLIKNASIRKDRRDRQQNGGKRTKKYKKKGGATKRHRRRRITRRRK